jgi:hypothetical protein
MIMLEVCRERGRDSAADLPWCRPLRVLPGRWNGSVSQVNAARILSHASVMASAYFQVSRDQAVALR